jgi:hypothetical protein
MNDDEEEWRENLASARSLLLSISTKDLPSFSRDYKTKRRPDITWWIRRTWTSNHHEDSKEFFLTGASSCAQLTGGHSKSWRTAVFGKLRTQFCRNFLESQRWVRRKCIEIINETASKKRDELSNILKSRLFSLNIDCATRLDRGFLGVNVEIILHKKNVFFNLGVIEVENARTLVHTSLKLSLTCWPNLNYQ